MRKTPRTEEKEEFLKSLKVEWKYRFIGMAEHSANLEVDLMKSTQQAADWKRVAGELAKCLKEGQERIICSEHYPFDEAAKALAAFEAMEKGEG